MTIIKEYKSPFDVIRMTTPEKACVFFICDHASNAIPQHYNQLGLTHQQLQEHIAWDIGSADLTKQLSNHFKANAIFCGFSRLLIDPNREPDRDDFIPDMSDGMVIPGNTNLPFEEVQNRLQAYHEQYHLAVERELEAVLATGANPLIISIHSFTRQMSTHAHARGIEFGVLWNRDPQTAFALMHELSIATGKAIGDNEPYSAKNISYTMDRHVSPRGLRHVTLEIRQDLISTKQGIKQILDLVVPAFRALILS